MDTRVWQRYVAVACAQAWKLDVASTAELVRCIETVMAAAPTTGSAGVRVLLGPCAGELAVDWNGGDVRIGIRSKGRTALRGADRAEP